MAAPRRHWSRRRVARGAAGALAAVLLACSASDGTGPGPAPGLAISAGGAWLVTGDSVPLVVRGPDGAAVDAGEVRWSSSDPDVLEVSAAGAVLARGAGSAAVTGSYGDAEGTAYFAVTPGSGERVPGMAAFDSIIPTIMAEWDIPGGAVAVVRDGRLVLARGYGWADEAAGRVVATDARFRVASVSKPVTAVAVLDLHEAGLLDLDAHAFDYLTELQPAEGETEDPRLSEITVRQLLHHAGGWDRDATFDPMFRSTTAAEAVGAPAPASAETVIRYMRGMPLQFDPGARYAYSNFGYAVLGRVIESVTGRPYAEHVREAVLAPMGIDGMEIGRSRPGDRPADEVRYYDGGSGPSVFPGEGVVPYPDGGFYLEAMDAHGGWIASTIDLLRFVTAVDGRPARADVLEPETIDLMIDRPGAPLWVGSSYYYGMGWLVRPVGAEANWWHDGSLPGTTALLVRAHNGLAWAALFNARAGGAAGSFAADLDQALWDAIAMVSAWPAHDLFAEYP